MKFFAIFIFLIFCSLSWGSDHVDGAITKEDGVSDITDLYAFPTPEKERSLTIIMNSYPMVPSTGHFEERLRYVFRVRQAQISKGRIETLPSSEHTIVCSFKNPHSESQNKIICESKEGLAIAGRLNQVVQGKDAKVWAGMRSDPFFFNAKWAISASKKAQLPAPISKNTMDELNVLSIVLEISSEKLFPNNPDNSLYAIVGEIYIKNAKGSPAQLLDRVGRPEITNVSLVNHQGEEDIRDLYNSEESFSIPLVRKKKYVQRLVENISYYDKLDAQIDWAKEQKQEVAHLLVEDFLVVDVAKECGGKSFLAIEKSVLSNIPHNSCGGRFLHEDIMDEIFSCYINFWQTIIRDGVDRPYRSTSTEFPYLAEPDTSYSARIKAWLARKFSE